MKESGNGPYLSFHFQDYLALLPLIDHDCTPEQVENTVEQCCHHWKIISVLIDINHLLRASFYFVNNGGILKCFTKLFQNLGQLCDTKI